GDARVDGRGRQANIRPSGATGAASVDPVTYWRGLAQKRLHLLGKRERRIVALLVRIHKLRATERRRTERPSTPGHLGRTSPASIICSVFGSHCSEAISVATCESTLNVYARNGDYEGLFQFGSFARAHYGFAWNALTQARAAYRYFLDAGWSPWQCRP
ncbi:MAG TPA: hypothetical protein VNH41_03470, partial [Steroidobacteraceae bacterium]|nr:hypothetical protein [Steroidobacteraceae bacterium]